MGKSSWENSSKWYGNIVGAKGHEYHQSVIFPHILKLLGKECESVLDLGCGQGVLSRHLPQHVEYVGIDLSSSLIKEAKKYNSPKNHQFIIGDITLPLKNLNKKFSHAIFNLSLQNVEEGEKAIQECYKHLKDQGEVILVLNHPCFRISRQSEWGIDKEKKIQYRRVDRYLTPLKIPIQMHPSQKEKSVSTVSFHHPLSTFATWLKNAGFVIEDIQEWVSPKKSTGPMAKMEDRAREEFPLFMAIIGKKLSLKREL